MAIVTNRLDRMRTHQPHRRRQPANKKRSVGGLDVDVFLEQFKRAPTLRHWQLKLPGGAGENRPGLWSLAPNHAPNLDDTPLAVGEVEKIRRARRTARAAITRLREHRQIPQLAERAWIMAVCFAPSASRRYDPASATRPCEHLHAGAPRLTMSLSHAGQRNPYQARLMGSGDRSDVFFAFFGVSSR